MPASLVALLPEDLWVTILSFLDIGSLTRLSGVCKQLKELCNLRVVWKRAFISSKLPLPPLALPHNTTEEDTFDYRGHLIHATQLNWNWTSSSPTPKSRVVYNTPVSSVWLFRSRYLVTLAFTNVVCWDLDLGDNGEVVWGASLQERPIVHQASEMDVKGSHGILLAYTVGQALGCSLLYVPLNDDGSFPPPRNLPAIETTNYVKFLGLEESGIVALACLNGVLILEDITTHTRRSIVMNEPSVWLWVDSITILREMIMVTRHKNRGIVIDLYDVPPLVESDPGFIHPHPSLPHAPQSRVEIKQAQIATVSSPLLSLSPVSGPNQPHNPSLYTFHVLAALPSSIDHYRLTITRSSPDVPPELKLLLLGDDQGSRQRNSSRVLRNTSASNTITGDEENDDYDSDSTLNRIAQPSQVLDLQIGSSGKRAMAIHIAAHTNDRTIWVYALNDEEGPLVARELGFSDEQLQRIGLETNKPGSAPSATAGEELRSVVRTHACRTTFDERSGRVVIGADCEELMVFQY